MHFSVCATRSCRFSHIWENKVFSVFITPTRVLGQMSAVHREWIKIKWAHCVQTARQHSQLCIYIECKYWQHMAHWKTHRSGKLLCFPHTHYPGNWSKKAVMKKVCACAFHERSHVWDETQPEGDALAVRRQNPILEERDEVLYM